jgi:acetolactate synthase-1/2/3 large subunit
MRDAYLEHSPVIAITGGRDPKTKFRKVYQEIDDVPAFEPVTKFNATIDDIARVPDMLRQAFRVATTGAPGPVHLQFRGNEGQLDAEEGELDDIVETQFAIVPPFRPQPEMRHAVAALDLLQKAERPIFIVRGGARASARMSRSLRSPKRCKFRSRPRSMARTSCAARIRCRSAS